MSNKETRKKKELFYIYTRNRYHYHGLWKAHIQHLFLIFLSDIDKKQTNVHKFFVYSFKKQQILRLVLYFFLLLSLVNFNRNIIHDNKMTVDSADV